MRVFLPANTGGDTSPGTVNAGVLQEPLTCQTVAIFLRKETPRGNKTFQLSKCARDFLLKKKEKVAFTISEGKCTKPHVLSSKIDFCVCDSDHHSQKNLTCSLLAELSESTSLSFLSVCVGVFLVISRT